MKRKRKRYPSDGNSKRDTAGVTVTMRHRTTGALQSVHRPGGAKVALRAVLGLFDPSEWCCQTVSTPRTILADLQGRPELHVERMHTRRLLDGAATLDRHHVYSPEAVLLGQVGAKEYRT